ncbi:hypothetical protein [Actinoplanes sp. NPDC049265]|uniref:hypothetical protein n=1 Tax=Actinoplanes sp. NPDC049265 TaxID=3363902 RepID=UPI003714ADCB
MSEGTQRLSAAFVEQAVARGVAGELGRSLATRRDLLIDQAGATRFEVERLRRVVAGQAAEIADLRDRLRQAQEVARRLTVRQLVDAVTQAVVSGSADLDGYAINDAHVRVRAAVEFAGEAVTVVADPGGLLDAASLSSFEIRLAPLPPVPGSTD